MGGPQTEVSTPSEVLGARWVVGHLNFVGVLSFAQLAHSQLAQHAREALQVLQVRSGTDVNVASRADHAVGDHGDTTEQDILDVRASERPQQGADVEVISQARCSANARRSSWASLISLSARSMFSPGGRLPSMRNISRRAASLCLMSASISSCECACTGPMIASAPVDKRRSAAAASRKSPRPRSLRARPRAGRCGPCSRGPRAARSAWSRTTRRGSPPTRRRPSISG
jgi:hypothetical protein